MFSSLCTNILGLSLLCLCVNSLNSKESHYAHRMLRRGRSLQDFVECLKNCVNEHTTDDDDDSLENEMSSAENSKNRPSSSEKIPSVHEQTEKPRKPINLKTILSSSAATSAERLKHEKAPKHSSEIRSKELRAPIETTNANWYCHHTCWKSANIFG